ncbi:tubulin binding cofactor C-domain-containing protein [Chaetomium tenue]|uniref:Tubulin binding cofactor C-domain-containing protein n=1 Tax=Chaetomium tenue TaxID=1854479 RepID=A0ACB7P221_9PEZI|nr:tubulin binding cofactor C-domain-containing protein [Chaetomium globosum]
MNTTDPKERFYRQFQNSAESIQDQINQLPNFAAVGGVRQDAVEHILGAISRLSKEVADAIEFVPAYDQRGYFDKVKSLEIQVNQAAAKFTSSKSRFRFKKRPDSDNHTAARTDARRLDLTTNSNSYTDLASKATSTEASTPVSSTKNYNAEIASLGPDGLGIGIRKPSFSEAHDINLADHIRVHITLPASASRATSAGTLTNLHQCVVDMSLPTWTTTKDTDNGNGNDKPDADTCIGTPFASLTLKDIQDSAIVAGHVNGPVHVTGVRDSVVVVVARQVRIHECHNVVFYLHCVSRPIVEDCKGVRFAKAPGIFLTDKDKAEANLYDQVDDFKWLKTFSSPNWSLLPESEIIPDAVWKTALAGEPDVIIDTTLQSLGVKKGPEVELKN